MTIVYGLTPTGFVPKSIAVIRADIDAAQRAGLGSSLALGDGSVLGFVNGIMAERYGELWDVMQVVAAMFDPDAALDSSLDVTCSLTGTFRQRATSSIVLLTLCGTAGTLIPGAPNGAGSLVATVSTGAKFSTIQDATIAALVSWVTGTAYIAGDRATNASRAYQALTSGTSGATPPSSTADDFNDGGVHWQYLGEGPGAVDVQATSLETGPVVAAAADLSAIQTPIAGWQSARNLLDATLGTNLMTNEDLRVLREAEIATDGVSTAAAIKAALLQIGTGILSVTVFANLTDVTDANGLPPHAVECLVRTSWSPGDPQDQEIVDTIFANVAAGIATFAAAGPGAQVGTAIDSEGVSHTINWSRPAEVPIYVDITLTYDAASYPGDGDAEIKAAIVAFGAAQSTGKDAVAVGLGAQAFKVPGVFDVPRSGSLGGTLISTAPGPTVDTTIAISLRQLATFDTSRITVHSSAGTP